jgi:Tfp pilus assembly protein PilO
MGAHRVDRVWLLGGIVVTVLLAVGGWFLLINPKYADAATVRSQAGDSAVQLTKLRHQVADLNQQKKKMGALTAKLAANHKALPVDNPDVPAFLRQLQASGVAVDVDVSGLTVGTPVKAEALPKVWRLPITMIVIGDEENLSRFLSRLQTVQPRAVLVNSIGLTAGSGEAGQASKASASISLTAFVYSPKGTSATLTTK